MAMIRFLLMLLLLPALVQAQLVDSSSRQSVLFTYEFDHFKQANKFAWHAASLEYKQKVHSGLTLLGRVNYATRFGNPGLQTELEAYPKLSRRAYAYMALGYSASVPVFPRWRSAASAYFNLNGGWEVEGGLRYLRFDHDVWMGTAGMGKYLGNWYLLGRSFFSLNNPQGIAHSYALTARYYLPSGIDFVWVQAGTGISPDETQAAQLQAPSVQRQSAGAGIRTTVGGRHMLLANFTYARNEYRKGSFGNQVTAVVGYGIRF